jgi:hypothetical protein
MLLPLAASAHQHATFTIGGTQYDVVIGSLNEPIVVDDKTGLDLRVTNGGHMAQAPDGDMKPTGGTPAVGLEKTLKVEMVAGDIKKAFDLSPTYGTPGSYRTTFYPTSADRFAYRIYGTVGSTTVDLLFPCKMGDELAADEGEKDIGPGVKQIMKMGGFGCPMAKEAMGFPAAAPTITSLDRESGSAKTYAYIGIALGAIGILASLRKRS